MNIAPNPLILTQEERVEGITRAKLENKYDLDTNKVLPIIVHGDAVVGRQLMKLFKWLA